MYKLRSVYLSAFCVGMMILTTVKAAEAQTSTQGQSCTSYWINPKTGTEECLTFSTVVTPRSDKFFQRASRTVRHSTSVQVTPVEVTPVEVTPVQITRSRGITSSHPTRYLRTLTTTNSTRRSSTTYSTPSTRRLRISK